VNAHKFTKQARKFKQTLSARKLMATAFWDRKGVLMAEFMQEEASVMSEVYCETLKSCVQPL
jgi:acyl-CoA thioesterase